MSLETRYGSLGRYRALREAARVEEASVKRPPPLEGTEVGDRAEAEREVVALVPVEMGGAARAAAEKGRTRKHVCRGRRGK